MRIEELPDTSAEAIGARMMAVREALGLVQTSVATAMDMSPQRYNAYEKGRRVPGPEVLARFWQMTGATSDYLLFGRVDGLPLELANRLRHAARQQRRAS